MIFLFETDLKFFKNKLQMKFSFLVLLFFSLLSFACGSSSNSSQSTVQDPHSEMHQDMHNEVYQKEILKVLDGKWFIKEVMTTKIDSELFKNKQPVMIINVEKEIVAGNDGCNSFQGKIKVEKDKMTFGPLAGTLMACPNMDISDKITTAFSEKELTFTLNDSLILYDGGQQVLVLNR